MSMYWVLVGLKINYQYNLIYISIDISTHKFHTCVLLTLLHRNAFVPLTVCGQVFLIIDFEISDIIVKKVCICLCVYITVMTEVFISFIVSIYLTKAFLRPLGCAIYILLNIPICVLYILITYIYTILICVLQYMPILCIRPATTWRFRSNIS